MQGPSSTLFPPGQPPATAPRTMRDLAAALYRQAGLVAVCVLVGTAASLVLYANQPRVYTSTAKVWVQTEQQGSPSFLSGIAAYRETPYPDPVNRKIETEMELMLTRTNAQAVVDKLHIRDEQLARGIRSVAVPLRDRDGKVVAALNVNTNAAETSLNRLLEEYLPMLQEAARRINRDWAQLLSAPHVTAGQSLPPGIAERE